MTSYSKEELAGYQPPPYFVEGSDEFAAWYRSQPEDLRAAVTGAVELLEEHGPTLPRPHAGTISHTSGYRTRHANIKELRIQHRGDAYRIFFAFDPRRVAILLTGGRKPNEKWYKQALPAAEKVYDEYLAQLRREGWI